MGKLADVLPESLKLLGLLHGGFKQAQVETTARELLVLSGQHSRLVGLRLGWAVEDPKSAVLGGWESMTYDSGTCFARGDVKRVTRTLCQAGMRPGEAQILDKLWDLEDHKAFESLSRVS